MPKKRLLLFLLILLIVVSAILMVLMRMYPEGGYGGLAILNPKEWFGKRVVEARRFEVRSEDPNLEVTLNNPEILEEYARQFGVFDNNGIGIYRSPVEVDWVAPKKVIFVFTKDPQKIVEVYTKQREMFLSFEVKKDEEDSGNVLIYFNYAYSLLPLAARNDSTELEKNISASLMLILYKITHYNPRARYDPEEIKVVTQELYNSPPVLKVELKE